MSRVLLITIPPTQLGTRRTVRLFRTLATRRDCRCHYCAVPMRRQSATVDHVVPRAHGGTSDGGNLVLACRNCNEGKGNSTLSEWREKLASIIGTLDSMREGGAA